MAKYIITMCLDKHVNDWFIRTKIRRLQLMHSIITTIQNNYKKKFNELLQNYSKSATIYLTKWATPQVEFNSYIFSLIRPPYFANMSRCDSRVPGRWHHSMIDTADWYEMWCLVIHLFSDPWHQHLISRSSTPQLASSWPVGSQCSWLTELWKHQGTKH